MTFTPISRPFLMAIAATLLISTSANSTINLGPVIPSPDSKTGILKSIDGNNFIIELDDQEASYQVDDKTTFCIDGNEVESLSSFSLLDDKTISIETVANSPVVSRIDKGKIGMRIFTVGSLKNTKIGPLCQTPK